MECFATYAAAMNAYYYLASSDKARITVACRREKGRAQRSAQWIGINSRLLTS